MDYLYDGSFEGALTGIYQMFHQREKTDSARLIDKAHYQFDLMRPVVEVVTDEISSGKVCASILGTFGPYALQVVAKAYLSEDPTYGTKLFRCLKKAYHLGSQAFNLLGDPEINDLYALYRKVVRASHLFLGLLRFMELENGIYYAKFEHEYNMLTLVLAHFKDRMSDVPWVIHDIKRGVAAFYDGNTVYINPLEGVTEVNISREEAAYQEMWCSYFKHIAIDSRKNPRQQMQMMPKKYWKYLVERPQSSK